MALEVTFTDGESKEFESENPDNELSYKVWEESRFLEIREVIDDDPDEPMAKIRYDTLRKVNLDFVRDYGWTGKDS